MAVSCSFAFVDVCFLLLKIYVSVTSAEFSLVLDVGAGYQVTYLVF